jgi:hypothetical protein
VQAYERTYNKKPSRKVYNRIYLRNWKLKNKKRYDEWRRQNYRDKRSVVMKANARALRIEVIQEYGGVCKCCGYDEILFLTIDHVEHGRGNPKKQIGNGWNFYSWLKKNGFPKKGLQVLCMNCNAAKMWYGGACPHQLLKTPIDVFLKS